MDLETPVSLKLNPLSYHKERLLYGRDLNIGYEGRNELVLKNFSFELQRGERVFLHGKNGCGKSTWIKTILEMNHKNLKKDQDGRNSFYYEGEESDKCHKNKAEIVISGELQVGSGLMISYINQDTDFLKGRIGEFCEKQELEESLFCALLRQLDMERVQFSKNMEEFSEGQKKKVLIATSLMTPAHLYIWDEPLNYIDVFSRMQIEELLLAFQPTMLLVDHDIRFQEKIGTRVVVFQ